MVLQEPEQFIGERKGDNLTLAIAFDQNGLAEGMLYLDEGDGFQYQKDEYLLLSFTATKKGLPVL